MVMSIFLALQLSACKAGKSSFQSETATHRQVNSEIVQIPTMITDVRGRAAYVLKNFWDEEDFGKEYLNGQDALIEKKFLTFIRLLSRYPDSLLWRESVEPFVARMEKSQETYRYFVQQAEYYLYNPNSPTRNEKLYQVFVERFLASRCCDEMTNVRFLFQNEMMSKNNVGSLAADFSYTTADGKICKLSETANGKYLILLFYSPGCKDCENTKNVLENSKLLQSAICKGNVDLLATYIDGVEEIWSACKNLLPKEWISATDYATIRRNELYDLKAIPTIYLLDKEHRVLLKDVSPFVLLEFLGSTMG